MNDHVTPIPQGTPPGSGAPTFEPAAVPAQPRPRPHPRREPASGMEVHSLGLRDCTPESEIANLSRRLVAVLKREPDLVRRVDMLRLHHLSPKKLSRLERSLARTQTRIDRWSRELSAMKAPTVRAATAKADVLIEAAVVEGRREDPFDALAISLAKDADHLATEQACLPKIPGGNFGAYHEAILKAHADMEALPPDATDADADMFMDRWGEIDRMAMADRPRTFADAIGALLYARREFHQFNIEATEDLGGVAGNGDKLVLHLLDGALQVLGRVVQEDAARTELSRRNDAPATVEHLADLEFEPWDESVFKPHSDAEWADLANPYLVSARMAWRVCLMSKARLVEMIRGLPEKGDASAESLAERFTDASAFFGVYRDMMEAAWVRMASAFSVIGREEGVPEAQRGFDQPAPADHAPDRRAVAAYREWLQMEGQLLGVEMYPEGGAGAARFIPANTAASHYHFPRGTGASWRDLPQPASRAEAMCRVLGIDWTKDEPRDEHYLHFAPTAADATEAAA